MSNQRLALLIDTKRCIACNSCAVACKIENNLPDGNWWNRVMTVGGEHALYIVIYLCIYAVSIWEYTGDSSF